jgi:hypothetical protein
MRTALLALMVVLSACGSSPGPIAQSPIHPTTTAVDTPHSTTASLATPSSTVAPIHVAPPASGLLIAVVQNPVAPGCCGGEPTGVSSDTVAIYGLDGSLKASAKYSRRQLPPIGNAAVVLQAPAVVAGSGLYYIDGSARVWVLHPDGKSNVVASFPQKGQPYEIWFAVKPDGTQVVAGVVTYDSVGSYFTLYTAPSGGTSTQTVNSEGVGAPDPQMTNLPYPVGWVSAGPVAMDPSSLTTQNAWFGGPLQVLTFAADGVHSSAVGGPDCRSASITPSGLIPCISSKEVVSVRDTTGNILWTTHVAGFSAVSLCLSPNGQAISDRQQASSSGGATWYMVVETQSGRIVHLPNGFRMEGWLDNNTVIGAITAPGSGDEGDLSWVSLDEPTTAHDLGFKGDFVGTLA